jgi:predicted AAA+ superfamily ATPase
LSTTKKKYIDELIQLKNKPYIKVLIGLRNCGKSTILRQFKNKIINDFNIKDNQIIEYNFNNPKFEKYIYMELYDEIINKSQPSVTNYIFLDEIQDIEK